MSPRLRRAIDDEARALAEIPSAVARIDASSDVLAAVDEALDAVRQVRWQAVTELRAQGWSAGRLAQATTLSSSRFKQLAREARAQDAEHEHLPPAGAPAEDPAAD